MNLVVLEDPVRDMGRQRYQKRTGKVIYNNPLDTNLVVAFSPGEIYHDPDKQNNMNAVFAAVADLLK